MKLTLMTAIVLLTVPLVGGAQIPGYPNGCPTCGVSSYVDLPKPEATVSAANFELVGWGVERFSGRPADRVTMFYQEYDGTWHPLPQPEVYLDYGAFARVDVTRVLQPFYPNVGDFTGWRLRVTNPPPIGLRRVQINVWRGPYYEVHRRTYLVVP